MGKSTIKLTTKKPKILYLVDKKKSTGIFSFFNGKQNDTYEIFYNKLVEVPESDPVDIIITTHGGEALWCSKICHVLKNRSGKSRTFVKSYAHSAGAVVALTTTELYITYDATLSAIDAQGSPLVDLFRTSLQGLSRLVEHPISEFAQMTRARAQYFREITKKCLNAKHNKDLIMQKMHDETPIHEQLFFKDDMDTVGIIYAMWDGNVKNLPKNSSDNINNELLVSV
jgi:ClpP class serine protease